MTFDEAVEAIRAMPDAKRVAAIEELARAVRTGIERGASWAVFDPVECTPDMAARCWSGRRTMVVGGRVCATVFDSSLPCPHYGLEIE